MVQSGQSIGGGGWTICDTETLDCESEHEDTDCWCGGDDLFDSTGGNVYDFLTTRVRKHPHDKVPHLAGGTIDVPLHKNRYPGRSSCSQANPW